MRVLGIRVLKPRIYLAAAYLWRGNNYGYPRESNSALGSKSCLTSIATFSFYGSAYYFFNVNGNYSEHSVGLRKSQWRRDARTTSVTTS